MGQSGSRHDVSVVIVGGGYAGIALVNAIHRSCNVTVIDLGTNLFHSMAALRNCVLPGWQDMTFLDREGNWPSVKLVRGRVTGFNTAEKQVTVEACGEGSEDATIPYDYLVLATGSQVPFPGKVPLDTVVQGKGAIVAAFDACRERVVAAERIVIVGGGAVGVELAGEIAVELPGKEVTIIHAKEQLFDDNIPTALRQNVQKRLAAYGVKIVFGEKVDLSEACPDPIAATTISGPVTLKTNKDTTIEADLVFPCVGVSVNKAAYENSLKPEQMDGGFVKVNEFLQVEGEENVFALGDCCNVPCAKMVVTANLQGEHLGGVLRSILNDKPKKPYKPPTKPTLVLPVGRAEGLGIYNGANLPGFMVKKLKCYDLTTSRYCKDAHMAAPKYPQLPPVPRRPAAKAAAAASEPAAEGAATAGAEGGEEAATAPADGAAAPADGAAGKDEPTEAAEPASTAAADEAAPTKDAPAPAAAAEEDAPPTEDAAPPAAEESAAPAEGDKADE